MKNSIVLFLLLGMPFLVLSQEAEKKYGKLPAAQVKTLDGKNVNTAELSNDGKPFIVSFWALWCKPCIKELTTISEVYPDWVKETGVKIYAVSIDDSRSSARVQPTVEGKGWEYDVLLDPNGNFKRAMNVTVIPHTFLMNGKGEIVWQHTSFAEGAELELIDLVRKVTKGESLESK
jgi:cytochrome c biogenesis protein CcmG/thiol:disulfide interchange protein DsbE